MKKTTLAAMLLMCVCIVCLSMHKQGGTFEEKVLGACNLIAEDLSEINILFRLFSESYAYFARALDSVQR